MSFLLAGLIVAGASGAMAVGRWLGRKRAAHDAPPTSEADANANANVNANVKKTGDHEEKKDDEATKPTVPATPAVVRRAETSQGHLVGFPCQLGDVVMRLTGEEAWLAGGVVFSEEGPVAALFVAPEAVHDCTIYARPAPREAVYWMAALDPGAVLVGGEPPTSVEHGGIRFERVRRLPLRPKRIGVGAPDLGDSLVLAEYSSAGSERLLVLKSSSGTSFAYRGEELEPSSYEVIASGRSTLDD